MHVDDHTVGTHKSPDVPDADFPVKDGDEVVTKKIETV